MPNGDQVYPELYVVLLCHLHTLCAGSQFSAFINIPQKTTPDDYEPPPRASISLFSQSMILLVLHHHCMSFILHTLTPFIFPVFAFNCVHFGS